MLTSFLSFFSENIKTNIDSSLSPASVALASTFQFLIFQRILFVEMILDQLFGWLTLVNCLLKLTAINL